MTIFAGAFCSLPGQTLHGNWKQLLSQALRSRDDGLGTVDVFDNPSMVLVKWDSGAFNEGAWAASPDGNSISALVGDPLLTKSGERLNRTEQLFQLVGRRGTLNDHALSKTRGAFSIASFCAETLTLTLATDVIGLRSLYYTVQDGTLIFASALRILESLDCIPRKLSETAIVESSLLGFPLADRTPYADIRVLRESQKLTIVSGSGIELENYHDWADSGAVPASPEIAAHEIFSEFQAGIRLRLAGDCKAYAFLSGGMDSRAIVSSLASINCKIEALNFSPDSSQDQAYARLFSDALGPQCHLNLLPRDDNPNFSILAFGAKKKLEARLPTGVDRPTFMWSGDGGSVGLGHVYMDEKMVTLAEDGNFAEAVQWFFKFNGLSLPAKVLAAASRASLQQAMAANVLSELNRYPRADAGRRWYLFLLLNDQRRHLFKHFETIDQHGLEFLLPFYDVHFLKLVANTPARWGLFHRLYALWFDQLDATARATPWQTYPGHIPCPVPGNSQLSYQWAGRGSSIGFADESRRADAARLLAQSFSKSLPSMFSRWRLFWAAVLHGAGLRDCRHILTMLDNLRQLRTHQNRPS